MLLFLYDQAPVSNVDSPNLPFENRVLKVTVGSQLTSSCDPGRLISRVSVPLSLGLSHRDVTLDFVAHCYLWSWQCDIRT